VEEERLSSALVDEATKKSGLIWVNAGTSPPQAVWHVWRDGAAYLVSGGIEQPLPDLEQALANGTPVTVTVRSKDKGGRLVAYQARPVRVKPGTEEWDAAVADLHAKRLNAPDGEGQPARWARESSVIRLEPTGTVVEGPGQMPAESHAAPPPASPATTLGRLPYVLRLRTQPGRRRR
jgi:hypothetical protein